MMNIFDKELIAGPFAKCICDALRKMTSIKSESRSIFSGQPMKSPKSPHRQEYRSSELLKSLGFRKPNPIIVSGILILQKITTCQYNIRYVFSVLFFATFFFFCAIKIFLFYSFHYTRYFNANLQCRTMKLVEE